MKVSFHRVANYVNVIVDGKQIECFNESNIAKLGHGCITARIKIAAKENDIPLNSSACASELRFFMRGNAKEKAVSV